MALFAKHTLLALFLLLIPSFCATAQEENMNITTQGNRYISLKIKSLNKYNSRIAHQQKQLLNKLNKKEKHFAHKLERTDSSAYAQYKEQRSPSYDSISKISKSDTGNTAAALSKNKNPIIDSLRGVQSFVQTKSGSATSLSQTQGSNVELNNLQGKLNFRNYITQLITQRANNLKNLTGSDANIPGLKGIEKQVFYGKAKMNVYKEMEEDPTKAEDKAMEYLQGSEGFDKAMKTATQGGAGSMQSIAGDASQLEKMGYQTKSQMQAGLQQKFGGNLGGVSKAMTGVVSEWKDKQNELSSIKGTKQSAQQLRKTGRPTFKVNPMRGLPFWKRIEKQYNWQSSRASADGTQPAILEPSAIYGYKQTPKLIYGIGIGTAIGLGQNWQNFHISYQGIGMRSFTTWQWQYGIGMYAGYERMYNRFAFTKKDPVQSADVPLSVHNTADYNESILVGLTKSYHMNNKYNGQIQVLYDVWWQEKGLRSPIVLRFATITK